MRLSEIEIYELLRERMDEKEAKALIQYIESRVDHTFEQAKDIFSTKSDIYRVELKIAEMREETVARIAEMREETVSRIAEMREETAARIAEMREETAAKIAEMRQDTAVKLGEVNTRIAELNTKMVESKNDLLKWMISLFVGSTVAIIGTILTVMKMGGW